jgi:hypothetical protein
LRGGGASIAKDADDRLVVAIVGNHLNQECFARYIIGSGEVASVKIYREIIRKISPRELSARAGSEPELDVGGSIDGHRKSDSLY